MSKFLKHGECPDCGSENNLAIYDDHSFCFTDGCGYKRGDVQEYNPKRIKKIEKEKNVSLLPLPEKEMPPLKTRGISKEAVNKYRVSVSVNPDNPIEAVFPRFKDGKHVANQVRYEDKKFKCEGDISGAELFGQNVFPAGGLSITVTEGYYDAMSAYQLTGCRYPAVAVMSASSAKKEVVDNFEYLNSFKDIVLNFDNDGHGQKAAKEVASLFEPGKCRIMLLKEAKDANEYLVKDMGHEYKAEYFKAQKFMPDGLKLGSDLWDEIVNHKTPKSVPYPWKTLNEQTYGIRRSEVTLLTAETGVGKTSVVKAIEYALLMNPELQEEGAGVGFLHLEEPKYDTAIGLMSIHAGRPFHLPDVEKSEEELKNAYDAVVNSSRVVIWDHFGSNDIDVVLAKIRHMAAMGCRYIVVDHLSIIVSDHSGDERKQLDEISTKIKTLCMNLNVAVIAVIHLNRAGEIRGSAGPEQIANIVIRLQRDKKEADPWRRNVTKLTVEKNRFCGRTGPSSYLFFNEMSNCLEELTNEQIDRYERGEGNAGHEFV
jgi:twinkle protein